MRVLALCPSTTETLFALGMEPAAGDGPGIVGRTKFCVEPTGRVDALPIVGGTKDPRLDRVRALAPDLVLMNEEENRREDFEALEQAGVAVHTSLPVDIPSTALAIRSIGEAVGRRSAGAELADRLTEEALRVHALGQARPPVRYLYLIWRGPWMAAARGTYIDALLANAGGCNVIEEEDVRYPEVDLSALASRGVDRVLLSSEPYPFGPQHVEEVTAALGSIGCRVQLVDGRLLSWHGSSSIAGVDHAARVLARE